MSLLSIASKAAGAAASSSSSSKSSVASAGSSVGKGVSGVTVTSTTKSSTSTTKSSGPTGVAAIANAFDSNGGKSSTPAVIKTISSAGKAAGAGVGKTTNSKSANIAAAATSAGGASKTAHAAAIESYSKSSVSAGVGVASAAKGGVDLLAGRAVTAFAGMGALAGAFWLMGTGPAGGESEREFERMVNANMNSKGKTDAAGEKTPGEGASAGSAKPVTEPPVKGATPAPSTKGRSTIWEKPGDISDANEDFDAKNPSDVKSIGNGGRTGVLPDGKIIVVRPKSDDGRPTLEIQTTSATGRITYDKVRYGR